MKALHLRFCISSVFVAALGCGTVKNDTPTDGSVVSDTAPAIDSNPGGGGSFSLSATPMAVSVPIAGTGTVAIAVDRTGTPGDVMLSAASLPTGITVAFSVNPIPAGMASANATFSVAPGTAAGTSNVVITGSGGGVEKTVTVAVTATTITVNGTVRGARPNLKVRIPGKALVTSAADGTFSFTDVSPPYDLYVVGDSGLVNNPVPTVFYYQGLTRSDPTITAPSTFNFTLFPRPNTDTVTGTASVSPPATMIVAWESGNTTGRITGTSAYSVTASWASVRGTAVTGTLFGFQFATDPVTLAPTGFTGYASLPGVAVDSSDMISPVANLAMTAPATAALTGMITTPAGFPKPNISLTQQLGTAGSVVLWNANATTNVANSVIPLVGAGKAALFASAALDGATTQFVNPGLAAATDVTFALPAPSAPTAPLNAATNVTSTTPFTWSATDGAVYEVVMSATGGPAKALFQLYTTSATGKLPVVPELALPLNQAFTWQVNGFGPNASINDAAASAALESVSTADFDGALHWTTTGTSRTFTSAP